MLRLARFTNITLFYGSSKTEDTLHRTLIYITSSQVICAYGVGAGIEYALPLEQLDNISVKVEYLYLGTNNTQSTYAIVRATFYGQH